MATSGMRTRLPVGATPGSIQSISRSWVNSKIISSTTRSAPTVRDTGISAVSSGFALTKWFL